MTKRNYKGIAALFILLLWAVVLAQGAEKYKEYINSRFGYTVKYPDIYEKTTESDNGDGIIFSAKNDEYTLTVWGGYNISGDTGKSLLESSKERVSLIAPGSAKSGRGWYRIAYSDDGAGEEGIEHIFHEYGVVNAETRAGFILKYPLDEEKRFKPIIKELEKSLKLTR
jgi:hypothetical protein